MVWHVHVDLTGEGDEASVKIVLLGLPRQIKRINRDAVTAKARPGIEGLESEWLGRGGSDDFPNVETHAQTQGLELVHQGDVDAAIGAFQDDQQSGMQVGRDRLGGPSDIAQVGLVVLVERGGYTDDQDIHLSDALVVGSGREPRVARTLNLRRWNATYIGSVRIKDLNL